MRTTRTTTTLHAPQISAASSLYDHSSVAADVSWIASHSASSATAFVPHSPLPVHLQSTTLAPTPDALRPRHLHSSSLPLPPPPPHRASAPRVLVAPSHPSLHSSHLSHSTPVPHSALRGILLLPNATLPSAHAPQQNTPLPSLSLSLSLLMDFEYIDVCALFSYWILYHQQRARTYSKSSKRQTLVCESIQCCVVLRVCVWKGVVAV